MLGFSRRNSSSIVHWCLEDAKLSPFSPTDAQSPDSASRNRLGPLASRKLIKDSYIRTRYREKNSLRSVAIIDTRSGGELSKL